MEVRCDRCRARYVIADDRVGDEGLPVRCSACGHVFRVKKKAVVVTVAVKPDELTKIAPVSASDLDHAAAPPATGPAASGGAESAEPFSVRRRGSELRKFKDLSELQKWVVEGGALPEDEISERGEPWRRLRELEELHPFFAVIDRARQSDAALRSRVQATLIDFPAAHGRVPGGAGPTEPSFAPPAAVADSGPVLSGRLDSGPPERWENTLPAAPGKEPAWAAEAKAGRGPRPMPPAARTPSRRRSIVPILLLTLIVLAAAGWAAVYFFWPTLHSVLPPSLLSLLGESAPAESQVPVSPSPAAVASEAPKPVAAPSAAAPAAVSEAPKPAAAPATRPPATAKPAAAAASTKHAAPGARTSQPATRSVATTRPRSPEPEQAHGVKPLLKRARRLRQLGRASAALDVYGRAVSLEPENAAALAGRGLCYLDLSDYPQAEASFRSALQADEKSADALMGLAETYRYEGRRGEAVTYYKKYLAAHPDGEDAVAARNAIRALKE
jgi:predicted Zn finger-like uncharacterized protein